MLKVKNEAYIEAHTLRCEASYRGGGIEISVDDLMPKLAAKLDGGLKVSAYQNYLGGGIAGSIQNSQNFEDKEITPAESKKLGKIKEDLKQYFYNLNNGGGDEYMESINSYAKNQCLPVSGY